MPGTFLALTIGQSGLAASQVGQDIVGQNIANSGTAGYSVESVDFEESSSYSTVQNSNGSSSYQLGEGVSIGTINRASDQYLDQQVRTATSDASNQSALSSSLDQIQSAFGEPSSSSLNTALGTLFQSFNNLVNNPEDSGVRSTVIQSGDAIAQQFHDVQDGLTSLDQQLTAKQGDDVATVNNYGAQIATLNKSIQQSKAEGENANNLLDQRGELLDSLSALTNITTNNNPDGTIDVAIGSSDLVVGTSSRQLALTGANSLTARGDLKSGELAGLVTSQSSLATYQTNLDTLASNLITSVNQQHEQGAGLDGSTGVAFFTGTDANSIAINPVLESDTDKLAAAAVPAGGGAPAAGDASNATKLGALENSLIVGGTQTLQNYYSGFVSNLAGQARRLVFRAYDGNNECDTADAAARQRHRRLDGHGADQYASVPAGLRSVGESRSNCERDDRIADHQPVLGLIRNSESNVLLAEIV